LHHNRKKKGKIIDVSSAVAKKLGLNKNGLSKVRVELAEKGILE
jgi:rare lipoprotein A (peptidoglycan hydrolase)